MNYDIYSNSKNNTSRFALGRSGARKLFVLGLNPSVADQVTPDQTVLKVEGFAARHRYDGFVLLNLYPLRATDPKKMPAHCNAALAEQNFAEIRRLISSVNHPAILAAWGDAIEQHPFLFCCLTSICVAARHYAPKWFHAGPLTKSGNPRHLARLSYTSKLKSFHLENYLHKKLQALPDCKHCDQVRRS